MMFNVIFSTVLLAAASVTAIPVNAPQTLIVFNPSIISPAKGDAWRKGSHQVVRWNTTGIPTQRVDTTGVLLLGYMENGSENLDIDNPLAVGFPLKTGSTNITMPTDIATKKDYFLVLFGDSGNKSPNFTIN